MKKLKFYTYLTLALVLICTISLSVYMGIVAFSNHFAARVSYIIVAHLNGVIYDGSNVSEITAMADLGRIGFIVCFAISVFISCVILLFLLFYIIQEKPLQKFISAENRAARKETKKQARIAELENQLEQLKKDE